MKKTNITVFLMIFVLLNFTACGSGTKPETTVKHYFKAVKTYDFQKMSSYTLGNKNTLEEMDIAFTEDEAILNFFKKNASLISYRIVDGAISENSAIIRVYCKFVDGTEFIEDVIGAYLMKALDQDFTRPDMDVDALFQDTFKEKIPDFKIVYMERIFEIKCIKLNEDWFIEEITDDMGDVVTGNLVSTLNEITQAFNSYD